MKPLLLALLLVSSATLADGSDDPNFYRDFDKNPCAYDLGLPADDCNPYRHPDRSIDLNDYRKPDCRPGSHGQRSSRQCQPQPVPEPEQLAIFGVGLAALGAARLLWRRA